MKYIYNNTPLKEFYWSFRRDPTGAILNNKIINIAKKYSQILINGVFGKVNIGYCPVCEKGSFFVIKGAWLRDNYVCINCNSIPRVRHLNHVLQKFFPNYRELAIHESSPSGPTFDKFRKECARYVPTYFWPDVKPGQSKDGFRCENLESLTFEDASFDLVITQDVMEHVMNPDKAFAEIARTLKPGGAHVFTVPWYAPKRTFIRAAESSQGIEYYAEKDFHGNPINEEGALVVREWGVDLPEFIFNYGGLVTTVIETRDRHMGLDGKFLEVFVSRKPL